MNIDDQVDRSTPPERPAPEPRSRPLEQDEARIHALGHAPQPSVGRIVHYHPTFEEVEKWRADGPWAAIVTRVVDPLNVTLTAFVPPRFAAVGGLVPVRHARFSDHPESGCWSWPPRGR